MSEYLDVMHTRSGGYPTYIVVVPKVGKSYKGYNFGFSFKDDVSIVPRRDLDDWRVTEGEFYKHFQVERKFDAAAAAYRTIKRENPMYAESIVNQLIHPPIYGSEGWYDLLLPIADQHSRSVAGAIRRLTERERYMAAKGAVSDFHDWYMREGVKTEKRTAGGTSVHSEKKGGGYKACDTFYGVYRKTLSVVEVGVEKRAASPVAIIGE